MGPCINEQQLKTVMKYVRSARTKARSWRRAGIGWKRARMREGWFHEPTVFVDCDPEMRICQEEIFGPVVSLIAVRDVRRGDRNRERREVWTCRRRFTRGM